ncbi:Uncharacterized protein TCM_017116 [Theobroma cacao]|uniref:Uncharacterized protein n=1 Tax=Theobroma cacao TaxID=3641 RepID=A0A061EEB4_THECC|nr:Uncharacterized protein TCM_017116 [Theobroma cacao]
MLLLPVFMRKLPEFVSTEGDSKRCLHLSLGLVCKLRQPWYGIDGKFSCFGTYLLRRSNRGREFGVGNEALEKDGGPPKNKKDATREIKVNQNSRAGHKTANSPDHVEDLGATTRFLFYHFGSLRPFKLCIG